LRGSDVPTCAVLVARMVAEAEHVVRVRLTSMLRSGSKL